MDSKTIASGIRRYKHQESSRTLLGFETLVVSAIVGFLFKSWTAFGLTFLFFVIVSYVPILTLLVSLAFSLFWAMIGIVIGMAFVGSIWAAVLFAIIGFLISFGMHLSAYED